MTAAQLESDNFAKTRETLRGLFSVALHNAGLGCVGLCAGPDTHDLSDMQLLTLWRDLYTLEELEVRDAKDAPAVMQEYPRHCWHAFSDGYTHGQRSMLPRE